MRTLAGVVLAATLAQAEEASSAQTRELAGASLEELLELRVTSVARKAQKISEAAAAVYVLTRADIERSGATSLPEALRMVPGVNVARLDASKWAVTARGFNSRFANKMLVLIDGRTIYNNIYSGVFWEHYDLPLEDVERVEVIRGPGGTMWGANAVNGVINVITRHAKETIGGHADLSGGIGGRFAGSGRWGAHLGPRAQFRVYGRYALHEGMLDPDGSEAGDRWAGRRGGGRLDLQVSEKDSLLVQADFFSGDNIQVFNGGYPGLVVRPEKGRIEYSGGSATTRWTHRGSDRSEWSVQTAVSGEERTEHFGGGSLGMADLDFQHRYAASRRHEFVWGLGYRRLWDDLPATFSPRRRHDDLFSSFVQDDIALIEDRLVASIGSKFQHNDYSGFEIQPGARLLFNVNKQTGVWAGVSRAVRTPSRVDQDLSLDFRIAQGALPIFGRISPNPSFRSETLRAVEIGFRRQIHRRVSLDLALFDNEYGGLGGFGAGTPLIDTVTPALEPGAPLRAFVVPMQRINMASPGARGAEAATVWNLAPRWKVQANYSFLRVTGDIGDPLIGVTNRAAAPVHQFAGRNSLDLTKRWRFDTSFYWNSRLREVAGYSRLDARLAWEASETAEVSLGLYNLLDDRHPEFRPDGYYLPRQIRRSAQVKVSWRF